MSANSIREQILVYQVELVRSIIGITTVKRVQPSDPNELAAYSNAQMPLASVVGSLPDPTPHEENRSRGRRGDVFMSDLKSLITVWFINRVDPDTQISSLLDDIWRVFYADQFFGGLSIGLKLAPQVDVAVWDPYTGFNVEVITTYIHSIGGI